MDENKIIMLCQIVSKIIYENQLPDEDAVRKILGEKEKERGGGQRNLPGISH